MINFLVGLMVIIGAIIIVLAIMFFTGVAVILGFSLGFLLKFFIVVFVVVLIIWFIGKMARGAVSGGKKPPASQG